MSMSDPIADMLTRIRNASMVSKTHVSVPASRIKAAIAAVLKQEGYIDDFETVGSGAGSRLEMRLKYFKGSPVIEEITRVSTPGCRIYARSDDLPSVRGGLGVALISTSKGVMTDQSARRERVGGEVLCTVF
ncbi:MAG: 30S ribosomal protein S8 [Gammaproteobacteria bacterium]|nr:30S ribosomal protein S8 [Gammaproteobacteria bacterium]MDD9875141.1 30S ribosomal protein S8 [Gammaproteobacteria bacterium]